MKVIITGGTGFIGLRLAHKLAGIGELTSATGDPQAIDELVLFDSQHSAAPLPDAPFPIRSVIGDIGDRGAVTQLIDRDDVSVFHLASVVSGGGELDFDLAMHVNLDGGRNVLEALRALNGLPRLVFASSVAAFGGSAMPGAVGDQTKQTPQTTYGITKAILELLINDYTRKGFLDGRSARLPTVIIRPGKPNAAASSFVSGVFREPLERRSTCTLPVQAGDGDARCSATAPSSRALLRLHEICRARASDDDRAVSLPSLTVSVQEHDRRAAPGGDQPQAGQRSASKPDPFIVDDLPNGWPQSGRLATSGPLRPGAFRGKKAWTRSCAYYIADYLDGSGMKRRQSGPMTRSDRGKGAAARPGSARPTRTASPTGAG